MARPTRANITSSTTTLVVSYQGASKMVATGVDNDALARNTLTEIVTAKHGRH